MMNTSSRPIIQYKRRRGRPTSVQNPVIEESISECSRNSPTNVTDEDTTEGRHQFPRKKRRLRREVLEPESVIPSRTPNGNTARTKSHVPRKLSISTVVKQPAARDSCSSPISTGSSPLTSLPPESPPAIALTLPPHELPEAVPAIPNSTFEDLLSRHLPTAPSPTRHRVARSMLKRSSQTGNETTQDSELENPDGPATPRLASRYTASSPISPEKFNTSPNLFSLARSTRGATSSPIKHHSSGLAKRMLGRANTESAIILSDSSSLVSYNEQTQVSRKELTATLSLPNMEKPALVSHQNLLDLDADEVLDRPDPHVRQQVSHKRTYANTRSFLVPLSRIPLTEQTESGVVKQEETSESALALGDELEQELRRESYADLRARWGVDASEDDEEALVLKSITEMRSKGESRRFLDEMGWLYEGLEEGNSIVVQRSSAIEIMTKMCDDEFMRRAKAADFISKTWDLLVQARKEGDIVVLDTSLVFLAALISREPHAFNELANATTTTIPFLAEMILIPREKDPLRQVTQAEESSHRPEGWSKQEYQTMRQLSAAISQARLFRVDAGIEITVSYLTCRTLRQLRFVNPIYAKSITNSVSTVILRSLEALESELKTQSLTGNIIGDVILQHTDEYLSLVDDIMIGKWAGNHDAMLIADPFPVLDDQSRVALIRQLLMFALVSCILREGSCGNNTSFPTGQTPLRIIINLTNGSESWCTSLQEDSKTLQTVLRLLQWSYREFLPIQGEEKNLPIDDESNGKALDRFCLTLGILTNVIREIPESRATVRELGMSATCTPALLCMEKCRCSPSIGAIPFLVLLYKNHAARATNLSLLEDTFLTGHLAVLLGLLCDGEPSNQEILLESLTGATSAEKLDNLVYHVEQFAASYDEVFTHLSNATNRTSMNKAADQPHPSRHHIGPATATPDNVAYEVVHLLRSMKDQI